MDYIKQRYDMPFLKRGMTVEYYGYDRPVRGKITGADGPYLRIKIEGNKLPGNYHPTYALRYFDKKGNLILDTKK